MGFKVDETLVIMNVDNRHVTAPGLLKVKVVDAPEETDDWAAVRTADRNYVHVAFKKDNGWQVRLVCRDIDGTVFPDDIRKVYVIEGANHDTFAVVDGKGVVYRFPVPAYENSLLKFAMKVDDRFSRGDVSRCEEFLIPSDLSEADLIAQGVCVYEKPCKVVSKQTGRNTVTLDCISGNTQIIGAEMESLYGLGIGNGEEGRAAFISREQAEELVKSLLKFIEGGE